ncbi:MAG: IPT/TIG domain-containing protein [Candidatus Nanosyncoccaceae bacterium]
MKLVTRKLTKFQSKLILRQRLSYGFVAAISLGFLTLITPMFNKTFEPKLAYAATPAISSISPNRGLIAGGNTVTISGSGFDKYLDIAQVSVGHSHTCALTVTNKAYCWGANWSGQLGNGTTTDSATPVAVSQGAVPAGTTLTSISVGHYHTCAVGSNGKAYCWGYNGEGRLGDGSTTDRTTPVAVAQGAIPTTTTISKVFAGGAHTCAINSQGRVYCWGNGGFGQLGNGSTADRTTPVAVSSTATFTALSMGYWHTCGLASGVSRPYCWGQGTYGQLGNGSTANRSTPVLVSQGAIPSGVTISKISPTSGFRTCSIGSDNRAYCWGAGGFLGNGQTGNATTPIAVSQGAIPSGVNFSQVDVSVEHSCAVATNNKAYCWGLNTYGQVGDNTVTDRATPVAVAQGQIPTSASILQVSVGGDDNDSNQSCALTSDRELYCWGGNFSGQVGDGTTTQRNSPVATLPGQIPSATAVTFGGTAATNIVVNSATSISARVPAHSAGSVNVVVTNPGGETATLTNGYTYYTVPSAPAAPSVSPSNG